MRSIPAVAVDSLDRALMAFWRLGYEGCSISDLVEATGLHRQSLYNAYGDKKGLFMAAAARYRLMSGAALEPLRGKAAGLAELRSYFENFLNVVRTNGCGACLLVRTAFSVAIVDDEIRALIEEAATEVRTGFVDVLENAVRKKELPAKTDVKAQAAYLFCVLHGLSALAQTGASRKQVAEALSQALDNLR